MKKQTKKDKDMEQARTHLKQVIEKNYKPEEANFNLFALLFGLTFYAFLVAGFITLEVNYFVGAVVFLILTQLSIDRLK